MKAAKTTSLRRRIHCDVICHTTARRRSWQLSPDSEIGPSDPTLPGHSWGQYLVGTIPRSIRICVPTLVMIGPAVWPPILDRHTHTQNLYYVDIDIINVLCSQFQYTVTWVPNVCTAVHGNVYEHSVDMFVKTRAMSCYKFGSL